MSVDKQRVKVNLEVVVASVLLHVGVAALVIFVKPIREFVFQKSTQEGVVVSHKRLQEILKEMLDMHQTKAVLSMADLAVKQRELMEIRDRQLKRLAEGRKQPDLTMPGKDAPVDMAKMKSESFLDIFGQARVVEGGIVDIYKQIRAIRMAMMRPELTMQEAIDSTTVMTPSRIQLVKTAFDLPIPKNDEKRLSGFKAELKRGSKELQSIQSYCAKLVEFAKDIDKDANALTLDLFMQDQDLFGGAYRGPTLMPDELFDTHEYSMGSFHPLPGRKLKGQGQPNLWLYIDTWYVIGPFPNERRRALDTRFGPEAGVDLDATYVGKNNREVKWQYLKSATLKVEPFFVDKYAIYYAYSEIYAEREREVWLSTGTDDHGKVWINDELIWTSGSEPKPFKADEHVQMVKLKPGFNEILIRCENAGGTMGFCLLFCTADAQQ